MKYTTTNNVQTENSLGAEYAKLAEENARRVREQLSEEERKKREEQSRKSNAVGGEGQFFHSDRSKN